MDRWMDALMWYDGDNVDDDGDDDDDEKRCRCHSCHWHSLKFEVQ